MAVSILSFDWEIYGVSTTMLKHGDESRQKYRVPLSKWGLAYVVCTFTGRLEQAQMVMLKRGSLTA